MRATGPTRRRNQAWLEMQERKRQLAQRQVEEKDDGADTSDSDSDADGEDTDLSDSDLEEDSEDEKDGTTTPPSTISPPNARPTVGAGAGVALLPVGRASPVLPGVTLGAEEGAESDSDGIDSGDDDSADESSTASRVPGLTTSSAPAISTSAPGVVPVPITTGSSGSLVTITTASPTASSGAGGPASQVASSGSLDQLLTSAGVEPTPIPTPSVSRTAPVVGGAQSPDADSQTNSPQGETLEITQDNHLNTGEAVGIVMGVLALIGLLIFGAFFWKKFRKDRGLPFLPPRFSGISNRFSRKRGGADDMNEVLVPPTFPGSEKTNTKIIDDLMKAAYAAENGGNDMAFASAYGPDKFGLPPPQAAAFMDEKAYIALAGPPTPRTPKKPVSQWLNNVTTPRQSRGPVFPPSPSLPPDADEPPIRTNPNAIPGTITGPRLDPPRPTYGRDTMTTDTTNTSVRWYG